MYKESAKHLLNSQKNPAIAIQARLSSNRFPGKVLAKLQDRTVIEHVINSVSKFDLPCFVLTSEHRSDDPLVEFLENKGFQVFRGSLNNVLERYVSFANTFSLKHLVRLSADSPLLHPEVVAGTLNMWIESRFDVVTNVYPRSFPKGQSVEVINSDSLRTLDKISLEPHHREHITSYIYENAKNYEITNFFNSQDMSHINLCVDYPEDLIRLDTMLNKLNLSLTDGLPPWPEFSKLIDSRPW